MGILNSSLYKTTKYIFFILKQLFYNEISAVVQKHTKKEQQIQNIFISAVICRGGRTSVTKGDPRRWLWTTVGGPGVSLVTPGQHALWPIGVNLGTTTSSSHQPCSSNTFRNRTSCRDLLRHFSVLKFHPLAHFLQSINQSSIWLAGTQCRGPCPWPLLRAGSGDTAGRPG